MVPQTSLWRATESESSQTTGASSNAPPAETPQQCRYWLLHCDAVNVVSANMTQDAHLRLVCDTGSSKNKKQHALGCEWINIEIDSHHLMIYCTAGGHRELCEQFIDAHFRKLPLLTKAFVRTVHGIKHHHVISSRMFADKVYDMSPREWTKQDVKALEEVTEVYVVELIPNPIFRCSNWFLVGFQHVSAYGKARRSGTARTVLHAPCLEQGQNPQRRVFTYCNWWNVIPLQQPSHRSPRREEARCCVSRASKGKACNGNTPGYGSWKSNGWLPSLPKWHSKESTDTLKVLRYGCTSIQTNAISHRNAPCTTSTTWRPWGSWYVQNHSVPPRYVYIHTSLPNAQFFNHNAYAKHCKSNQDCSPNLLIDTETTTG